MSRAHRFNRRRILVSGGLAAAAGLAGFGGLSVATASAETAAVPASGKFDLTAASDRLFWKKPLYNGTVMQCFAFDNTNKTLYTMQRTNGATDTSGDLTVTKLSQTGTIQGHMYLKGFGHGIAFGVQPSGSSVTMWTEADAQSSGGSSARARVVCRFAWKNGATITKSGVTLFEPVAGMYSASCSLDVEHGTIAVRYTKPGAGQMLVTVYKLAEFAAKKYDNPLATIGLNEVHPPGITPQGYQHYGQHLYLLQGTAYDAPCSQEHPNGELQGNTYVSRINFNNASDFETRFTHAGYSLSYREPEGLGLVNVDGKPRLAMGFASACSPNRLASIYYKHNPAA